MNNDVRSLIILNSLSGKSTLRDILRAKRDILLKFHEKSGQFVAAAQSTAISFPLRIVYLVSFTSRCLG